MTILATTAIRAALADGAIVCDPPPAKIEGAHIDVTLGAHWWLFRYIEPLMMRAKPIDVRNTDPADYFLDGCGRTGETIHIPAHGFILAHTQEFIGTAPGSGLIPCLHTRSTLARWGLSVCTANAGFGDEGFCSSWTLEIINPHPVAIALPVGARVGCITFQRIEGAATPYAPGTRYNARRGEWQPSDMLPKKGNW